MVGTSLNQSVTAVDTSDAVDSIRSSNADAVAAQRKFRRLDIRLKVVVRPGNSIDRAESQWMGECHDISKGGCRVLAQQPLQLGSVYWIQFEQSKFDVDPVFARCVRGHMLRENAFECGMSFLTQIELPEDPAQSPEEASLT